MVVPDVSTTVHDLFLRRARLHPARVALELHDGSRGSFTYAQVRFMATAAARALRQKGVGTGSIVATCIDEGYLMIITHLAILLAGGALVPVDPNFPCHRVAHMLHSSRASFIVAQIEDHNKIAQAITVASTLGNPCSAGGAGPTVRSMECALDDEQEGTGITGEYDRPVIVNMDHLTASLNARGFEEGEEAENVEDREEHGQVGAEDACWIFFTSGSSGVPKAVLCQHQNAVAYLTNHPFFVAPFTDDARASVPQAGLPPAHAQSGGTSAQESKRLCRGVPGHEERRAPGLCEHGEEEVRVLVPSAFTFDPSVGDIFATLAHGGRVCVASRTAMLGDLGGCLSSMKITHVCSTPAVWRLISKDANDLTHLKVVALGGEPMPETVVSQWAGRVTLMNLYGTTEATVYQVSCCTHSSPKP
jgi:non-ribosomal peptide synthetase component F